MINKIMINKGDKIVCVFNYAFESILEIGKKYIAESYENEKNWVDLTINGIKYSFNKIRFKKVK
jgi:hypothetical protein